MHFDNDLIRRLRDAQRLVFFTGAGISQESGILTFREGANKIWGDFDPKLYASQRGFDAHPAKVWQWYSELRPHIQALQPNAHHVVALGKKK
ncbi:Sir2 family NAD-dependent protein deacetylase [Methylobacter psychrophilus]|uniref:Sir2 family NAD-dependent protein deacetylase n=1 Tax=Methylobacter psychrophilus TaxID=96941 RepID=UPI0021D49367|nr:Sir2 family NAD-dependent protein deacetylase [Methylobacter psychrophilus]